MSRSTLAGWRTETPGVVEERGAVIAAVKVKALIQTGSMADRMGTRKRS
jgi:hypothetical protein